MLHDDDDFMTISLITPTFGKLSFFNSSNIKIISNKHHFQNQFEIAECNLY